MPTPDGYYNELWARTQPAGGDLADVSEHSGDSMNGKSEVVLLIHGYNAPVKSQRDEYQVFIEDVASKGIRPVIAPSFGAPGFPVFKFFWPGDWDNMFSAAAYMQMVGRAPKVGDRLEKYLNSLSGPGGAPMLIHIVSHSLGNRVTLELLDYLRTRTQSGQHQIVSYTLMAAAVPENRVKQGNELHDATLSVGKRQVLYSRSDTVLHWAFPPGETLAGEGFFPTAIGRSGEPSSLWTTRRDFSNIPTDGHDGYRHSDYWRGDISADEAAKFLGVPINTMSISSAAPTHTLPLSNTVATKSFSERLLAVTRSFW